MALRLMVVDDHPVVIAGLHAMLAGTELKIVAEASSCSEALAVIEDATPDVLLLDVRLPDEDGVHCLGKIREAGHRTPALMFSGYENPTFVARASALGASGYLTKTASKSELTSAILKVAEGQTCWTREDLRKLTGALATQRIEDDLEAPLTKREAEVLKQLAFGLTNKEIAKALGISYETVKEHVQHILRKVGVSDRTQVAVWAVRRGLV